MMFKVEPLLLIFLVVFCATYGGVSSFQAKAIENTILLPAQGSVSLGHYYVNLVVGKSPNAKTYSFYIDSGCGLTWLECDLEPNQPCSGCIMKPEKRYKPKPMKTNVVKCKDPLCTDNKKFWPRPPDQQRCTDETPEGQCSYAVRYVENSSNSGVIVDDFFSLPMAGKGETITPTLAFGCGYKQKYASNPPLTSGLLGIGKAKGSILSQLSSQTTIANVVGHCLCERGGFVFFGDGRASTTGFGDDLVPPPDSETWVPMLTSKSYVNYYSAGGAAILFGGQPTSINNLDVIFDSGSSETYINSNNYKIILDSIKNNLRGKPVTMTKEEPYEVCWKRTNPNVSIDTIISYFMPLSLVFTNTKNVQLKVEAREYLIVTKKENVCLGVENGTMKGFGDLNVIGDTFMQNKVIVYDNNKNGQIAWYPKLGCR